MNSKVAYMQPYCSHVVIILMWVCVKRKSKCGKKRENNTFYYFIR